MQNKQPRLQIFFFPNIRSKSIKTQKKKNKFNPETEKAGVCSKVAITRFWTSKGENKAQAQRKNRNYLVTKVYYMFNTKKGMEKNVPLLKLIHDPWSIKTMLSSRFMCVPLHPRAPSNNNTSSLL